MPVRNTRDDVAENRRRLPLPALMALLAALPMLAACGGLSQSGQGTPLQDSPIVTEADEGAIAEALAAGVDSADVEAAAEEADEMVDRLDEPSRREFYRLFGADPLGLSSRPVNAARYEIPLEMNEQVERWIEYFTTGDGRVRFRTRARRPVRGDDS